MSKITITPLGTCRINTPLKRGATRYPIEVSTNRIYGYTHTSQEAVQQLEFLMQEREFPSAIWPVLLRPAFMDAPLADWQPTDLHVVEISSLKCNCVGDTAVQANYLGRHFADFFASVPRTRRFWDLARQGDAGEIRAFLEAEPVYNLYSPEDREMLAGLRQRLQSFEEVFADMATLTEKLGRERIVFVTHVNVHTPGGTLMASRDKIIRWTRQAAERLGVPCFDPTDLVHEVGQERAMERGGLDTTHFTNVFADRWYSHFHKEFVLPQIRKIGRETGTDSGAEISLLSESIAAVIEYDDFFDGARQLFEAVRSHPDDPQLRQLRGQVLARIGDYDAAVRDLLPYADGGQMSTSSRIALAEASLQTGDYAAALTFADRLLQDEYELSAVYDVAGQASMWLGDDAGAARYFMLAFRQDPTQKDFAVRVLDLLAASSDTRRLEQWIREIRERFAASPQLGLAIGLAQWAVSHGHDELLVDTMPIIARGDPSRAVLFIEQANDRGMLQSAARAIMVVGGLSNESPHLRGIFQNMAQKWAETSEQLVQAGRDREADAFALALAALMVQPSNSQARKVERTITQAVWTDVREAQLRRDHVAIITHCEAAGLAVYHRPAIAIAFTGALLAAGRADEAYETAQLALAVAPDNIDLIASLAHAASVKGALPTALRMYSVLDISPEPRAEKYRVRTDRFLTTVERSGPRHLRELAAAEDFPAAVEFFGLLRDHTQIPRERLAGEGSRIRAALRIRLNHLAEAGDENGETLRLLKMHLAVVPDDPSALRRAALESMKQCDFDSALAFFQDLDRVSPGAEATLRLIGQCQAHLAKRERAERRTAVA